MSRIVGEKPEDVSIVQFQSHVVDLNFGWLSQRGVAMYGLGSDGNVYAWSIEFGYWALATENLSKKYALESAPAHNTENPVLTAPSNPKENEK